MQVLTPSYWHTKKTKVSYISESSYLVVFSCASRPIYAAVSDFPAQHQTKKQDIRIKMFSYVFIVMFRVIILYL